MNDDLQTYIEPELEARIVALVLGEASAFEAEDLERLMSKKPELESYRIGLEKVHGVLAEAQESKEDPKWKLSEDRRGKILAKIDEKKRNEMVEARRKQISLIAQRRLIYACAACVFLTLMIFVLSQPLGSEKESSLMTDDSVAQEKSDSIASLQDSGDLSLSSRLSEEGGLKGINKQRVLLDSEDSGKKQDVLEAMAVLDGALAPNSLERGVAPAQSAVLGNSLGVLDERSGTVKNRKTSTMAVAKKPSAGSLANGKAIAAWSRLPAQIPVPEIPVPEIEVLDPLTDFGDGDDFGAGGGKGVSDGGVFVSGIAGMPMSADRPDLDDSGEVKDNLSFEYEEAQLGLELNDAKNRNPSIEIDPFGFDEESEERTRESRAKVQAYFGSKNEGRGEAKDGVRRSGKEGLSRRTLNQSVASQSAVSRKKALAITRLAASVAKLEKESGLARGKVDSIEIAGEGIVRPEGLREENGDKGGATGNLRSRKMIEKGDGEASSDDLFMPPELPFQVSGGFGGQQNGVGRGEGGSGFPLTPATPSAFDTKNERVDDSNDEEESAVQRSNEALKNSRDSAATSVERDIALESLEDVSVAVAEASAKEKERIKESELFMGVEKDRLERAAKSEAIFAKSKPATQKKAPTATPFETSTAKKADSTFSLNVSDVSFKLAKAALSQGRWPDASKVRPEEFVNALSYDDIRPTQAEKISFEIEQGSHPFMQQRNLMRVSMTTASLGRNAATPLRLTILLDQSGSMERADRAESVQKAFALLAGQLNSNDELTLVGFARTPRLLAERVKGNEVAKLAGFVANPLSEGGTNLEEALSSGLQLAKQQFLKGAQNRIILITDGAANLGDAKPKYLAGQVESMRRANISFDACGVGADGLNDEILNSLTKQGDGRYYFLDDPDDADDGFAQQIAGALRPAAKNVKVQVLFNPERVSTFKLYGFEKHKLKKEDFRNDAVDAAEMAAEESGVALYHFEPMPEGRGDVGTVSVRFLDPTSDRMIERTWSIPYQEETEFFSKADPKLRLAGVTALFAEKLKGSLVGDRVELKRLRQEAQLLRSRFGAQVRFDEFQTMLQQAGE